METLLEGDGEAIAKKAIEMAKAGDGPALRLCMDRLIPARRDRHVSFDLPKVETAADAAKAVSAILEGVAAGEITPSEAAELSTLVGNVAKALEISDLEERIRKLEAGRAA